MTLPDYLILNLPEFPEVIEDPTPFSYDIWLKQCEALLPTLNKIRLSPENLEKMKEEKIEPFRWID